MPNSKQIVYLSQAQYAELIANGTITVDGVTVTYDENDIYVTPQAEPVTDVRVAGTSIAANGVAEIPIASSDTFGVMQVRSSNGASINNGYLFINYATSALCKNGISASSFVTPSIQYYSAFYGLAKAAGHDEKDSTESLGTYTPGAKGAIQQMLGVSDLIATPENDLVASKAYAIGDVFTANGKLYKATAAIAANAAIIPEVEGEEIAGANCEEVTVAKGFVKFTDIATNSDLGIVRGRSDRGITITNGWTQIVPATAEEMKAGEGGYRPLTGDRQHIAAFYGLAKASGDTTQSASSNAVGTYTDNAKASIKSMLGIVDGSTGTVDVSGTTPTITAVENTRYVCGEVSTLSFTPPASGISIVRFTSGTTATSLTLPSTVKFPEWFDATTLEANTIYEICITDGVYGAVMSWAL